MAIDKLSLNIFFQLRLKIEYAVQAYIKYKNSEQDLTISKISHNLIQCSLAGFDPNQPISGADQFSLKQSIKCDF